MTKRYNLFFTACALRSILQPRGVSPCSLFEALLEQSLHLCQLAHRGRPIQLPDSRQTQTAVGYKHDDVESGLSSLQCVEILTDTAPRYLATRLVSIDVVLEQLGPGDWRATMAAIAHHLESHSLRNRTDCARIDEEREIGVTVDVNEPRGHHKAACVKGWDTFPFGECADFGDSSVADRHIATERLATRSIHDRPADDDQISIQWRLLICLRTVFVAASSTSSVCSFRITPYCSCAASSETLSFLTSHATAAGTRSNGSP